MKNVRDVYHGTIGIRCSYDGEKESLMQLLHNQGFRWVSGATINCESESNQSIFPYYITVGKINELLNVED